MELKLLDKDGKAAKKSVTVSDATFGREFNEALLFINWLWLTWQMRALQPVHKKQEVL